MTALERDEAAHGDRRWSVVLGCGLALVVGNGAVMQFTFGIFLKPIAEGLGLTRVTVSAALSLGLLATAFASPIAGRAMDRLGTRRVLLAAITAFALCIAATALLARGAASLVLLYALSGIAAAGHTPTGYARSIVSWFGRNRGLALGLAMTGVGFGSLIVPAFAAAMMPFGWRAALLAVAGLILIIGLPSVSLFVSDGPGAPSRPSETASDERTRISADYVAMVAGFTLAATAANGTVAHIIPILTDRGLPLGSASAIFGWLGLSLIAGRLVAGLLLDRLDATLVTIGLFLVMLVGLLCFALSADAAIARLGTVALGAGLGAEIDVLAYLLASRFGVARFGGLYGTAFCCFMIGSAVGPLLMGLSFDRLGGYRPCLITFATFVLAATLLLLLAKRHSGPIGTAAATQTG